jgi:predicted transcriptional regulator of viral defense system
MKKSRPENIMVFVKRVGRPVFTTHELVALSGRSASTVTQCLFRLAQQGLLIKIYRGVWAEAKTRKMSPFEIIPCLLPRHRVYVSFITALHLHGIIEQIPRVITLASPSHTKTLRTQAGIFSVHQMAPSFFDGFDWYKGEGSFLIATPEKALIDSLYLSSRKKKQFGSFPELRFPPGFSFKKAHQWIRRIPEKTIRSYVLDKLKILQERTNLDFPDQRKKAR